MPDRAWPPDVADYLSSQWPFSHRSYQWNNYYDQATFEDTLTTLSQESQEHVPRVGTDANQPCRILARPSDAGHAGKGVWLLRGPRVTGLAMMAGVAAHRRLPGRCHLPVRLSAKAERRRQRRATVGPSDAR